MLTAPPHSPPIISSQSIHKQITRTEYHHMTQQPPALLFHARLAQIGELTGRRDENEASQLLRGLARRILRSKA